MEYDYTVDTAADHSAEEVESAFESARTAARRAYGTISKGYRTLGTILNRVAASGVAAAHYADIVDDPAVVRDLSEDSREATATRFAREEVGITDSVLITRVRKYARILAIWKAAGFPTAKVRESTVRPIPADASDADILAVRERIASEHGGKTTAATVRKAGEEVGIIEPSKPRGSGSEEDEPTDSQRFTTAANTITTMLAEGFKPSPTVRKALLAALEN